MGKGTYKIIGDTIKFQFIDTQFKRGKCKLTKTKEIKNAVIVNIIVVDSIYKQSVPEYKTTLYSEGKMLGKQIADTVGKARVHAPFNQKPIQIEIQYDRGFPFEFEITEAGEYTAWVELGNIWVRMEPEHEKTYKLLQFNKTHLVIQALSGDKMVHLLTRLPKKSKE